MKDIHKPQLDFDCITHQSFILKPRCYLVEIFRVNCECRVYAVKRLGRRPLQSDNSASLETYPSLLPGNSMAGFWFDQDVLKHMMIASWGCTRLVLGSIAGGQLLVSSKKDSAFLSGKCRNMIAQWGTNPHPNSMEAR